MHFGRYVASSVKPALPSDRSFGWTFTGVFALAALLEPWLVALAALTAAVTLVRAQWLAPFKRAWMRFGELLHRVVSPLVLGLIYLTTVVPIGLLMRLLGRDLLSLKLDRQAQSYWVVRAPPGPAPETMIRQF